MIDEPKTPAAVAPEPASTPATPLLLPESSAELTTRTGLHLFVRPASPDDEGLLRQFFARLTSDDLRFRFLTPLRAPDHDLLQMLTGVDHEGSENFLAFTREHGRRVLVATAMIAAEPDLSRAEVAIAVQPDFRRQGIGWTMLDHLARYAEARGIKALESVECRDNRAAIDLEREMGFVASVCPGDSALILVRKTLAAQ